jgi:hypothetical protein
LVQTIVAQDQYAAGSYSYTIDAQNLVAGLYFIQITANNTVGTERMIVIK